MRINNLPHEWLDHRLAPPCDSGSLNFRPLRPLRAETPECLQCFGLGAISRGFQQRKGFSFVLGQP
jgi:hypothetical protein